MKIITKKLYIFDLDGTLVDAYEAIHKSTNFTLKKLNCPPVSLKEVKRKVGRGDRLFMGSFFKRQAMGKALKIYRSHHKNALLKYTKLKKGAISLLSTLKSRGKIVAIASNRPKYFTNIIITGLKIKKFFDMVLCADEIESLKPSPKILNTVLKKFNIKKEEAVYTGDMDIDMETAERAGIEGVFITGGSSTLRDVSKYRNKKIVFSLKKILELYE